MKTLILGALVFAFSFGLHANTDPTTVSIDTESSSLFWKGYKVTGEHEGTINLNSGELVYEGDKLVGGKFIVDMQSITVTDISGKGKTNLEGHLKSSDFFSVEEHPEAHLNLTKVISRGTDGSYKVIGDLTIKGITNPVKFNISTENGMMNADISVDRSEYNVRYGSGSFFDNLGDKTIYDEFDLMVKISPKTDQ